MLEGEKEALVRRLGKLADRHWQQKYISVPSQAHKKRQMEKLGKEHISYGVAKNKYQKRGKKLCLKRKSISLKIHHASAIP